MFERHFWKQQNLAIYKKWRGRKRSRDNIQVSGLDNWIDVGVYNEKDNKGTETDLKEEIINSICNTLSLNAGAILR